MQGTLLDVGHRGCAERLIAPEGHRETVTKRPLPSLSSRPAEGVRHLQAAAEAEPANTGFQVMLARALVDSGRAREVLAMGRG